MNDIKPEHSTKKTDTLLFCAVAVAVGLLFMTPIGYPAFFLLVIFYIAIQKTHKLRITRGLALLFVVMGLPLIGGAFVAVKAKTASQENPELFWGVLDDERIESKLAIFSDALAKKEMFITYSATEPMPFSGSSWYFSHFATDIAMRSIVKAPDSVDAADVMPISKVYLAHKIFVILPKEPSKFFMENVGTDPEARDHPVIGITCMIDEFDEPFHVTFMPSGIAVNALHHEKLRPAVEMCKSAMEMADQGEIESRI